MANALVHTSLPVLGCGTISKIPETGPVPYHTLDNLTHIDCYMDDVITAVQGQNENVKSLTALSGPMSGSSRPCLVK